MNLPQFNSSDLSKQSYCPSHKNPLSIHWLPSLHKYSLLLHISSNFLEAFYLKNVKLPKNKKSNWFSLNIFHFLDWAENQPVNKKSFILKFSLF